MIPDDHRRGWDSNPRTGDRPIAFRDMGYYTTYMFKVNKNKAAINSGKSFYLPQDKITSQILSTSFFSRSAYIGRVRTLLLISSAAGVSDESYLSL